MRPEPAPPPESPFLVPFDGTFRLAERSTEPPDAKDEKGPKKRLKHAVKKLAKLQRQFWAHDRHSLLLVFQAMDAAGKDSTIRAVLSGVNPAGVEVASFGAPTGEELDHDFLWRHVCELPERGQIGVFNRSWYEEVLVVRVHPSILDEQRLPEPPPLETIWSQRFESIRDFERHLARNGTVVLKFFLNISREEQRQRFLRRLRRPDKHWKFSSRDVVERGHWDEYQHAYEEALAATSRPWAPWYAIPADDKPSMRATVAELILASMKQMSLEWPQPSEAERAEHERMRELLLAEGDESPDGSSRD